MLLPVKEPVSSIFFPEFEAACWVALNGGGGGGGGAGAGSGERGVRGGGVCLD